MNGSTNTAQRPALFLDRDGTLIEDRGHLSNPSDVVFFPGTFEALKRLQEVFALFIVTNQRGVADGVLSLDDVERVNAHVVSRLAEAGVKITEVYVCPHKRSDNCICIKPKPYFLEEAARDYNVNLADSFTVGDHPHDVELAWTVRATGIFVLTGHGEKHVHEVQDNTIIAADIEDAANRILMTS
jgi:histidinol-phosphate phosphatase family protein